MARAEQVGRALWQARVRPRLVREGAVGVEGFEACCEGRVGGRADCGRAARGEGRAVSGVGLRARPARAGRLGRGRTVGHRLGPDVVALGALGVPPDRERLLYAQQVVVLVAELDLLGPARPAGTCLDLGLLAPERADVGLVGALVDDGRDVGAKVLCKLGDRAVGVLDRVV